jgi:cell division septum initiation protein DivIVA
VTTRSRFTTHTHTHTHSHTHSLTHTHTHTHSHTHTHTRAHTHTNTHKHTHTHTGACAHTHFTPCLYAAHVTFHSSRAFCIVVQAEALFQAREAKARVTQEATDGVDEASDADGPSDSASDATDGDDVARLEAEAKAIAEARARADEQIRVAKAKAVSHQHTCQAHSISRLACVHSFVSGTFKFTLPRISSLSSESLCSIPEQRTCAHKPCIHYTHLRRRAHTQFMNDRPFLHPCAGCCERGRKVGGRYFA